MVLAMSGSKAVSTWPWARHFVPMAVSKYMVPKQHQGFASPGCKKRSPPLTLFRDANALNILRLFPYDDWDATSGEPRRFNAFK